jgi:hypothetical protein
VQLVEVDAVGIEPVEAALRSPSDPPRRGSALVWPLIHGQPELRRKHHVVPPAAQRLADDDLRFAERIDVGRVDQVDAHVEGGVDHAHRFVVVRIAHRTEVHRAQRELTDRHAGTAEIPALHR